ncbi:carboxymuconolactone decarboxylase family protein [Azomonas macrocytogenes]|uniref:4-carboxymuconolactone decarboxylase n=1 Tax=Azomonas macrocytogenes TaxID=69962 RepID=A0A839T6C2_AZOMA|nr:carboxymuconolactone decarboxylase family protein [Azomonas macrocytogenes]MBB3104390.1 4-carboxymuconolactone decarboxylase [Azomonas macrocytogenes]
MTDPANPQRRSLILASAVAVTVPAMAKAQIAMSSPSSAPTTPPLLDQRARRLLTRLDPSLPDRLAQSAGALSGALDPRARALVGLATFAAMADAAEPYQTQVRAALAAGVQPGEVVEVGLHVLVYAGFPAAQAAIQRTQAVFQEDRVPYRAASGRPQGNDRALGLANLRQAGGDAAARTWAMSPSEVAPLTVGFAHGEIWNRPGLSVRDREIITLAMLMVSGDEDGGLTFHATTCRRLGWSREAIVETLIQTAGDAGLARLLAAIEPVLDGLDRPIEAAPAVAQPRPEEADQALSDEARQQRGQDALNRISQASGQSVVSSFDAIAPDLGRYILEFSYGDIFARPGLDLKARELATVAALTATGRTVDEIPISVHINAALNVGASPREVTEAILHMLPYVGFPRVQKAMTAASDVFAERRLTLVPIAPGGQAPNLTIIGRLRAKPGRGAELQEALLPVVAASRQEAGCINYDLHVDEANPDSFVLYENWTNQAALDAHFQQPHSTALAARLPELLEIPLTMERLTEVSAWIGRKSP